jgi:CTP:molybdopterin cytidylyltransferase MocA
LIEPALQGTATRLIFNPQPEDGQVSSQRLGLAALRVPHEAVIVALADQPLVGADDVPGNPVIFSDAVREEILRSEPTVGARQWREAHPEAVAAFDTPSPHYRFDIDTPEDLARFQRETGRTLVWPQGLAGLPGG